MKNIFLLLFIFTSFIQLSAQNIAIDKKEWTSVYITKIFTNADSAKLAYQNIIEKKKIFDRTYDNDIKQLSTTFVKSTFETTSEFDNRKALAINNKKNDFKKILAGLYDQLKAFDNAIYIAKGNRFKISIAEKDYNADLSEWKFKILDVITNATSYLPVKIEPKAAEKLWLNKDQIVVRQVVDFANPTLLMIELDYPQKPGTNLLVYFLNTIKIENNDNRNNSSYNNTSKYGKPKAEMAKFTPPKIVKDEEVKKEDEFKEQEKLEEVKISSIDQEGVKLDVTNLIGEPSYGPEGPPEELTDKIFTSVQIQSTFPGGTDAWVKFLSRTLNRDLPVENGAPAGRYAVTVSFVVSRDGSISDVKAENDPGYGTADEAVRVIKKGPKLTPAELNGYKVNYRHRQVIVFQVTED
jgi:hypothetical protein